MGRILLMVSAVIVGMVAALCVPASSLAATFTWSMPGDFTSAPPGANPDHDRYGGTPWTYVSGTAPVPTTPLSTFSGGFDGGMAGWLGGTGFPQAFVAVNPTGSAINFGGDTFSPGQVALQPPANTGSVAIQWVAPSSGTASISGTVTPADHSVGCAINWGLDINGNLVQSSPGTSISLASQALSAGDKIDLVVSANATAILNPGCDAAVATLQIQKSGTTSAPTVTLTSPAPGAVISGGQPTFAGSATEGSGARPTVTVRVYSGSSASGTPVRTLTASVSGGAYQVAPSTPLPDGTYTARAEQDDTSSPPNAGLSSAVTFAVRNSGPSVKLNSPGSKPLLTSTPTLTGVASTASGDARSVAVGIFAGSGTSGKPVRFLTTSVGSDGKFSVRVKPGLADGRYTALAGQSGPTVGISNPVTFVIKVHPPAVAVSVPAAGGNVSQSSLRFSGVAGDTVGDLTAVEVLLYRGARARGRPIGTLHVRAAGAGWTAQWPSQLSLGLYTILARQTDDVGHVGVSRPHTFLVVPGPTVLGYLVTLDRSGNVSLPVSCIAPAGTVCTGTVSVLTQASYQPVPGGPVGQIRVLFAYVSVPAGKTVIVRGTLDSTTAQALRRLGAVKLQVSASFGAPIGDISVVRRLRPQ